LPMSSKRMGIIRQRTTDDGRRIKSFPQCRAACRFSSVVRRSSSVLRPHPLRRVKRGDDDVLITGAAAQITGNGNSYLLLGRIRIVAQELNERRQNARRAEAALQAVIFMKRLLERMQSVGARRDPFDGHDFVTVRTVSSKRAPLTVTAIFRVSFMIASSP
jgi:hypothetical protein